MTSWWWWCLSCNLHYTDIDQPAFGSHIEDKVGFMLRGLYGYKINSCTCWKLISLRSRVALLACFLYDISHMLTSTIFCCIAGIHVFTVQWNGLYSLCNKKEWETLWIIFQLILQEDDMLPDDFFSLCHSRLYLLLVLFCE